jgi:hypothetical protein
MAENHGRQRGKDDGREHVATAELLGDPQINPPPSAILSSPSTKTASAPAADKKPGYYSRYLKDLPRHERRRIEREIRKRRKPGESWSCR